MNFFGHAEVASVIDRDLGFVMGAMLPDLIQMARVRMPADLPPRWRQGVDLHHRTDARFHASDPFLRLSGAGRRTLRAVGVRRGPALAAAHVGVELLLDGELGRDEAAVERYREALAVPLPGPCERDLAPLEAVRARLRQASVLAAYRDLDAVTERLGSALARRPRLMLLEGERPAVRAWLAAAQPAIAAEAPRWIAALTHELRDG